MDAEVALRHTHPACVFIVVNKAGLISHTCQKRMLPMKSMCHFSKQIFHQQGLKTTKNIATRDRVQHTLLVCNIPTTIGKLSACSIWINGWCVRLCACMLACVHACMHACVSVGVRKHSVYILQMMSNVGK